jgi:hypothetical protein
MTSTTEQFIGYIRARLASLDAQAKSIRENADKMIAYLESAERRQSQEVTDGK